MDSLGAPNDPYILRLQVCILHTDDYLAKRKSCAKSNKKPPCKTHASSSKS
jgi:hypothetical protein